MPHVRRSIVNLHTLTTKDIKTKSSAEPKSHTSASAEFELQLTVLWRPLLYALGIFIFTVESSPLTAIKV